MKCAVVDIETSGLEAVGHGFILCAVVKPLNEKPIVFRYDKMSCKPGREIPIVKALVTELSKYQMLVGHNIVNFDWPFIRSRAVQLSLPIPEPPLAYDTCQAFRRTGYLTVPNFKGKPSARLDMVADFFGIEQEKTSLLPREHWKAVWQEGDAKRKAMDSLVDHCVKDVRMTEKIYWRLVAVDKVWGIRRLK